MTRELDGLWLGRQPYAAVHALQERLFAARKAGSIRDTVLLLEHTPVITYGRGAHAEHVLFPESELARRGVDVVHTGRGGDVTVHAPGQLVAYPIVDLAPDRCDVRRYVRDLAEVMRRLVAEHGVSAGLIDRYVGLWVDAASPERWPGAEQARTPAKLGAIGVRISRWITMHGFALNATTDLGAFGMIVPCGIVEHGVTSITDLLGSSPSVETLAHESLDPFREIFEAEISGLESVPHAKFAELWPDLELRDEEEAQSSVLPTVGDAC